MSERRNTPWSPGLSVVADAAPSRGRSTDRLIVWAFAGFVAGAVLIALAMHRDRWLPVLTAGASDVVGRIENALEAARPEPMLQAMPVCRTRSQSSCVVDGDTIRFDGVRMRLIGIDAPELFSPGCEAERQLAELATRQLSDILSQQPFRLYEDGIDRYQRPLIVLTNGDGDIGRQLVRDGLAHPFGDPIDWC